MQPITLPAVADVLQETNTNITHILFTLFMGVFMSLFRWEYDRQRNVLESAREQAEIANRAKSEFLAIVNHELRTPLNSLVPLVNALLDNNHMLGTLNERQEAYMQRIQQAATQELFIVNNMLDASRMDSGQMEIRCETHNLCDMLRDVYQTALVLGFHKREQLTLNLSCLDNPQVNCDRQALKQVLLNLVSNAVKFTDKGTITIAAHEDNGTVLISVTDTGAGIAPEQQASLFERWTQTDTGRKKGSGSGLGLFIAHHFVEAHNGTIWLESQVGQGSTFYVKLPL